MNKFILTIPFLILSFVGSTASLSAEPKKQSITHSESLYQQGKKLYDQKKYNEAFPLLLKAAEMGHADAQMHVGKMYYNGWGVGHSHEKGKEWHKKAAAQGNKESIKKLKSMDHH